MSEIYVQINYGEDVPDYHFMVEQLAEDEIGLNHSNATESAVYHSNGFGLVISDRKTEITQGTLEIYLDGTLENKKQLCKLLGVNETSSEETVIGTAYHRWGELCSKYFKGDYAIVLIDQYSKKMLCVRSPFGLKALYYYMDGNTCVVATSHKKYIGLKVLPVSIEYDYIAEYFAGFDSASRSITPFQHWYSVLPGETIYITENGSGRVSLWHPKVYHHTLSEHDTIDYFKELFVQSVRRKIHENEYQHYNFNLSGGLDSSAILCALMQISSFDNQRLTVFHDCHAEDIDEISMFEQGINNETILAQKMCDLYGLHLNLRSSCEENLLLQNFEPLRDYTEPTIDILYGLPSGNASPSQQYPVITGFGGDQILNRDISFNGKRIKQQHKYTMRMYQIYEDILNPDFVAKYSLRDRVCKKDPEAIFDSIPKNDQWNKIFRCDQWVGDQDSYHAMRVFPYLDSDLVEYCLNLPDKYLVRNGYSKYVLRKAFEKELPQEILLRRGKGNHVSTIYNNIRNGWGAIERRYDKLMLVKYGIADEKKLLNLLQRFKYGIEAHMIHAMKILAMEMWLETKQDLLNGQRIV